MNLSLLLYRSSVDQRGDLGERHLIGICELDQEAVHKVEEFDKNSPRPIQPCICTASARLYHTSGSSGSSTSS
ncbi:hypothetical protein HBH56_185810 [Parastagonospora nodorum]|nr:hypothetical protein HBH56_185810 [Parastagonospora nodorum]KAH3925339.1 hypothetical protein HBH54_182760 [Parastagonospora nodorum]KAH4015943.1 hypothetical protein HBI09_203900 [Parastagonospora nodorum]KAH4057555.1 hypothetical protein HBH50_238020 [Parastagonospora nodorum]KAH4078199.1 hypothetical protein HBH48_233090 [Parastagonospora nodorum]